MDDKLELRRKAKTAAAHLALTAQRLARAGPKEQAALLSNADKDLAAYRRYKRALGQKGADDAPSIEPIDIEVKDVMDSLHEVILAEVAPLGFALFVMSADADASVCYTTNVHEEDLGAVLQRMADAMVPLFDDE